MIPSVDKETVHKSAGWGSLVAMAPVIYFLWDASARVTTAELAIIQHGKDIVEMVEDHEKEVEQLQDQIDDLDETELAVKLFEKDMEYMKKTLDDILEAVKP